MPNNKNYFYFNCKKINKNRSLCCRYTGVPIFANIHKIESQLFDSNGLNNMNTYKSKSPKSVIRLPR